MERAQRVNRVFTRLRVIQSAMSKRPYPRALLLLVLAMACGDAEHEAETHARLQRLEEQTSALQRELTELRSTALPVHLDVPLALPGGDRPSATAGPSVSVHLSEDEVFLAGEPVALDQLGAQVIEGGSAMVIIHADSAVPHSRVLAVIDELRSHGVEQYALAVDEQEE